MKARIAVLSTVVLAALAFAAAAQAHVTVHPNALSSGGFTVINVQVPNERDKASTVRVDVQFPDAIYIASPAVIPGWKTRVITKKLPQPVEVEPGFSVSSRVDRVVFTGGRIGPGQFLSFPVSIKAPTSKAGTRGCVDCQKDRRQIALPRWQRQSSGNIARSAISRRRASRRAAPVGASRATALSSTNITPLPTTMT